MKLSKTCKFCLIFMISFHSFAQEKFFILKNELKHKKEILTQSLEDHHVSETDIKEVNKKIFEKVFSSISPESNNKLYSYIQEQLSPIYQKESQRLIQETLDQRKFDLGLYSSDGFSWQKPMGIVTVKTQRNIQKNHLSLWNVTDLHSIEIDAKTFLEKLINVNLLEVSDVALTALANIKFTRTFSYQHTHNTYHHALTSDVKKLFLPFTYIDSLNLKTFDHIQLEDAFQSNVQAVANMSVTPYLEIGAKAGLEYDIQRTASLKKRRDKFLELKKSQSQNLKFTLNASLKANLFSIIKLSLIEFGFYSNVFKSTQEAYKLHPLLIKPKTISHFFNSLPISRNDRKELMKFQKFSRKISDKNNGFSFNFFGLDQRKDFASSSIQYVSPLKKYTFSRIKTKKHKKRKTLGGLLKSEIVESILGFQVDFNLKSSTQSEIESEHLVFAKEHSSHTFKVRDFQRIKKRDDLAKALRLIDLRTNLIKKIKNTKLLTRLKKGVINDMTIHFSKHAINQFKSNNTSFIYICSQKKKPKSCVNKLSKLHEKMQELENQDPKSIKTFHKVLNALLKHDASLEELGNLFGSQNIKVQGRLSLTIDSRKAHFDYHTGKYRLPSKSKRLEDIFFDS